MARHEHVRNLVLLGIAGLGLAFLPHALSLYVRSFVLFTMMYVVLALSWNIISGFTGYTSFGHVAFYGIGAYACAVLVADYGWHWLPTLGVGAVLAALVGAAIGYPVLRLKGPYFAIAMLGAAEGTRVVATVWDGLTHGGLGISLPSAETSVETYYAMLGLMLLTTVVAYGVGHSRFGIRLNAIREDEVAAEALGIDATRYKLRRSCSRRCSRPWRAASRPTRSSTSTRRRCSSSRSPSRWRSCRCWAARARSSVPSWGRCCSTRPRSSPGSTSRRPT